MMAKKKAQRAKMSKEDIAEKRHAYYLAHRQERIQYTNEWNERNPYAAKMHHKAIELKNKNQRLEWARERYAREKAAREGAERDAETDV